ncbi:MAG: hypothetical protein RR533_09420 [Carnobacterium sp.]
MKRIVYGVYDVADNDRCVCVGTTDDVSSFLHIHPDNVCAYVYRKKKRLGKYRIERIGDNKLMENDFIIEDLKEAKDIVNQNCDDWNRKKDIVISLDKAIKILQNNQKSKNSKKI